MNVDEPFTGTFAFARGRKVALINANGGDSSVAPPNPSSMQRVQVTITNANLKAATTVQILPAQGANIVIVPMAAIVDYRYGGTSAFTNTRACAVRYTGLAVAGMNVNVTYTTAASQYTVAADFRSTGNGNPANTALEWAMAAGALTGNPENNNFVVLTVIYTTVTI